MEVGQVFTAAIDHAQAVVKRFVVVVAEIEVNHLLDFNADWVGETGAVGVSEVVGEPDNSEIALQRSAAIIGFGHGGEQREITGFCRVEAISIKVEERGPLSAHRRCFSRVFADGFGHFVPQRKERLEVAIWIVQAKTVLPVQLGHFAQDDKLAIEKLTAIGQSIERRVVRQRSGVVILRNGVTRHRHVDVVRGVEAAHPEAYRIGE